VLRLAEAHPVVVIFYKPLGVDDSVGGSMKNVANCDK